MFQDSPLCDSGVVEYSYLGDVGKSVESALSHVSAMFGGAHHLAHHST